MNLFPIGYFSRTHGTKGQLILKLQSDFNSEDLKVLFIEKGGSQVPFFIHSMNENNGDWIIELEDVGSIEKGKELLNKAVLIDVKYQIEEEENNWGDYELVDKKHGSLGKVISVSDNGQQLLWHMNFKGKEVILPMVESFIEKIEGKEKRIHYDAPEGLIEVYLESE